MGFILSKTKASKRTHEKRKAGAVGFFLLKFGLGVHSESEQAALPRGSSKKVYRLRFHVAVLRRL